VVFWGCFYWREELCVLHHLKNTNRGTPILTHSFSSGENNWGTKFEFFVHIILQWTVRCL
jgi:hypothetical protein